ncbi:MAG: lipoprotein [Spirochaetales bacterium]|nr:lipoprotein [Spirochaetales bacterium]
MKKLILPILALILLTACSNITDLSDTGYARITIGESSGARYIEDSSAIDSAVMGFVEKDKLFNFADVENITDWTGDYLFTGIPVGDYSFMAMLMDDSDDIIAMKIQGVTIEAGLNVIPVEMGPGFEISINGDSFDLDDLGEDFTLSLDGNILTLGLPESYFTEGITLDIEYNNGSSITMLNFDGSEGGYEYTDGDGLFQIILGSSQKKFRLDMLSSDDITVTTYKIILKEI